MVLKTVSSLGGLAGFSLGQGFSAAALLASWARCFFAAGAALCIVCSLQCPWPLPPRCQEHVCILTCACTHTHTHSTVTVKNASRCYQMFPGGKVTLALSFSTVWWTQLGILIKITSEVAQLNHWRSGNVSYSSWKCFPLKSVILCISVIFTYNGQQIPCTPREGTRKDWPNQVVL